MGKLADFVEMTLTTKLVLFFRAPLRWGPVVD